MASLIDITSRQVLKDNQLPQELVEKLIASHKIYVPIQGKRNLDFTFSVFSSEEKGRQLLPDEYKSCRFLPYILDPNYPTNKVYILYLGNFPHVTNNPQEWHKLQKEFQGNYITLRGFNNDDSDTIENNTLEVDSLELLN